MSKVFYDHLISFDEIELIINKSVSNPDEKQDLWNLVDEILHHRVFGCILDKLPKASHDEFLEKFHLAPHDEKLIEYINEKINDDIEKFIKLEGKKIKEEIIQDFNKKNK